MNIQGVDDIGLDLMCVATYYSELHGNSENYISKIDDTFSNYILYFTKNTTEQIVDNFILNYIELYEYFNRNGFINVFSCSGNSSWVF